LQSSKPLSQLRGRFHQYREDERKDIAVIATYHPTFLLKNPEMKTAAWNDLQLIERKLKS
jgi:uracil-DNA glycosylase family 4